MRFEIEPLGRFILPGDSNFLFRAITAALASHQGSQAANELIEEALSDKSCAMSNMLPEINGKLFAPIGRWFFSSIEDVSNDWKKLKKMEYAELDRLSDFSANKCNSIHLLDGKFQLYSLDNGKLEKIGDPCMRIESTIHNSVPRLLEKNENVQTQIYMERDVFYTGVKFAVFARGSGNFLSKVSTAFQLLEKYGGLGHGRTTGKGTFKLKQDERELHAKSGQHGILMSALCPTFEEASAIEWEKSDVSFELCRTVSQYGKFRESALMISAGSRIYSNGALPIGTLKRVGKTENERGVYFGRALYV